MSSKWAVTPTIRDHYATFVDQRTQRPVVLDYLGMVAVPAAAAAVVAWHDAQFQSLGPLLAGVSIFTGFLFALLLQLFALRLRVADDPRIPPKSRLPLLIDQLFVNARYAILVGLSTAVVVVAADLTRDQGQHKAVGRWWAMLLVFFALHLTMTILMCLKRTSAAYRLLRT